MGGVTVSKPGIERDWWRLCFLEELALLLRAQGMLMKHLLLGRDADRIIFQALQAQGE